MIDLRTATPEELAAIEPGDFVEGVKGLSGRELDALMAGPARGPIIGSVFTRMPQIFRPERAAGATATTHWSITGLPGGGSDDWTVRVADGVERATWWERAVAVWPAYASYQEKTDREIPVVVAEPA